MSRCGKSCGKADAGEHLVIQNHVCGQRMSFQEYIVPSLGKSIVGRWDWDSSPSADNSYFCPLASLPCPRRQCFTFSNSHHNAFWRVLTTRYHKIPAYKRASGTGQQPLPKRPIPVPRAIKLNTGMNTQPSRVMHRLSSRCVDQDCIKCTNTRISKRYPNCLAISKCPHASPLHRSVRAMRGHCTGTVLTTDADNVLACY